MTSTAIDDSNGIDKNPDGVEKLNVFDKSLVYMNLVVAEYI